MITSATPLMEIQREALILGNNMSSGVTVPIFGKKITKMKQWEQLEVQDNSSENKASVWTNFNNFFTCLTGMKKLIFCLNKFFCSGHFFDPSNLKKWPKNDLSNKSACWLSFLIAEISSTWRKIHQVWASSNLRTDFWGAGGRFICSWNQICENSKIVDFFLWSDFW